MYTLLIADDEQLERKAIDLMLRKSGLPLKTISVRNGREAVEAVQQAPVDIALLDIRMPGLSGLEAAKQIAEIAPNCKIVFLTAWNSFDFAQEALRIGAKDYLVKPASPQEVITLLSRLTSELQAQAPSETRNLEEIRGILKQFNRSFFASLKYGMVQAEAMQTYFSLEGIIEQAGIALVFDGIAENNIEDILTSTLRKATYQACYFPSVDRISVLIFSTNPESLIISFDATQMLVSCPACHIGMGKPFHKYEDIPQSLRGASQAYLLSIRYRTPFIHIDRLPPEQSTIAFDKEIHVVEKQLIDAVFEADQTIARRLAHEIQDLLALEQDEDTPEFLNRYYEIVLITTRSIQSRIDHFSYEPLVKTSLMELERYFMDFIDAACTVLAMDRKDKFVRLFLGVESYIQTHYADALSLEFMAEQFNLSPSYFSRLCKEYLGKSFVDYLTEIRLQMAKQMIRTGMKIQEVAIATGFSDYSYFSRVFRNSEGLSPRDYRKKINN